MTEINLLRWRLAENERMQPVSFRAWFFMLVLMVFFGAVHGYLSHANKASRSEWLRLKNTSLDTRFFEKMNDAHVLQKKLLHLFDVLRCLEMNNIQVTQLYFQENKTTWTGWVDSPVILSNALTVCADHQPDFPIDNVLFDHPKKKRLHHFSFVIH